jgi:hypothetical protein
MRGPIQRKSKTPKRGFQTIKNFDPKDPQHIEEVIILNDGECALLLDKISISLCWDCPMHGIKEVTDKLCPPQLVLSTLLRLREKKVLDLLDN